MRAVFGAVLALALPLGSPAVDPGALGTIAVATPRGPLLPRSHFPLRVNGAVVQPRMALLGAGRIEDGTYIAPDVVPVRTSATVVVGTGDGSGRVRLDLAPWPRVPVFAVATYDDGIALHDARSGRLLGVLALGGGVADVGASAEMLAAPSSVAPTLWTVDLADGTPHATADVPTGNEVAALDGGFYVTNRDVAGDGALTRVRDGNVLRVRTGVTAEGLAIDGPHGLAYVGNVNDGSVAAVDLASMRVARRIAAPPRAFGVALDSAHDRLDVVSNVPRTSVAPGGDVESIDLRSGSVVARSAPFRFPLGIALDAPARRVFVTDEGDDAVLVLDALTLQSVHAPLHTCAVPWRPAIDPARRRLYVPCARGNAIAAFDLRTLAPLPGSPFPTGGYPVGITMVAGRDAGAALGQTSRRGSDPSR